MSKRQEWESLGESAQYKMILCTVARVSKRRGCKVDVLDFVGETWLKVSELLDGSEEDLPRIVWRAADSAVGREVRQLRKYAAADNFVIEGADGDGLGQVLDLVADSGSVEAVAILRADFGRYYRTLDEKNREIVTRRITDGETQERIAGRLDVSRVAVANRLHRMRGQVAAFTY